MTTLPSQSPSPTPPEEDAERPASAPPETGEHEAERLRQYTNDLADIEAKFERALASVEMVFQPIVHANDYALFGYEALLRSSDPELPHAGALLDAAERLHRLAKLGRVVRKHVAETFSTADESVGSLFVNLHALDLLDRSLTSKFMPLAKIAHRVVLEVTERASLDFVTDIKFRVAELREMGFRIAIDDLGAGHSRMDRFSLLDTDFVKLDMALVRDIDAHAMKRELVSSVVKLCHDHGVLVIGEGVETAAEIEVLIDLGCDLLQGYHIARPAPPFVIPSCTPSS
ncbi:MAG: EAL domain-containing protein [Haliangiales bacterium]